MIHRAKTCPYELVVIANDFQIPFHDERALLLFKMFLRRERPDWLILNGDFQDFWEISSYDLTPRTGKDFKREIETGKKILRSFRRFKDQISEVEEALERLLDDMENEVRAESLPEEHRRGLQRELTTTRRSARSLVRELERLEEALGQAREQESKEAVPPDGEEGSS